MNTTNLHTNLDYLKLMADGDSDMEQTMLEMLLTELPEEFVKMKSLYQRQDWCALNKVSHKMKSTLAFIGNPEMTGANKEIEQLTKSASEPDSGRIGSLLTSFENQLPEVMEELQHTLTTY